ncbi:5'-nucleotidase domain-containing protein 4 isoform X2 [Ananas comosus]|uniref:5'-nucleotidase domain-containing protein 4 isoform X2 n=1 Tax=Ananas comosus TaxID=4615 RepID=A0A6P5FQ94_ANACO|nr:5'-nucleotidase domain-containing protein 4 isoform X2 [Ananas comosus]
MWLPKRSVAALCVSALSDPASSSLSLLLLLSSPSANPRGCSRRVSSLPRPSMAAAEAAGKGEIRAMGDLRGGDEGRVWSSSGSGLSIPMGKQIFCNRSLNMKNITAVGFDMDYTLAQYKPETFEALAYQGTIAKLVNDLKYPDELLKWNFDWKYMVRGLVLDKKRGNILKMDRHKYVKVAYHGFREMSKEEKVAAYGNTLTRDSFDGADYVVIDTLFSLAEAYLFAQLVDFIDNNPEKVPWGTDYPGMCRDVRFAVDLCHRDGTLKKMVTMDPGSLWDYTNVVMNFLCGFHDSDDDCPCNSKWLEYFDVVITGSVKPSFFLEDNHASLFEVEAESGKLLNADLQIGSPTSALKRLKTAHKVYQGGSAGHLHRLLSIASSSQVLYVGDHIYGDILRSKKVLGWRTMLVIPELEEEVKLLSESKDTRKELRQYRRERDLVEDKIHRLEWSIVFEDLAYDEKQRLISEVHDLKVQREHVRRLHQDAQRICHQKFHKVWGQLMKTGFQNSRFAHQVERFACLYTSQVTNLGLYSPEKYYRPSEDFMPHEFDVLGL